MKYLLCLQCHRAWLGHVAASCCGETPLDCNPWSSDARAWYRARVAPRAHEIIALAHYSGHQTHRAALLKGIRAKGNTSVRARA